MTGDENDVAWPSYVDFLSTFIFVLILFIVAILYMMAQGLRETRFQDVAARTVPKLSRLGFNSSTGRRKLTISLASRLRFANGCPGGANCQFYLTGDQKAEIAHLANFLAGNYPDCTRIVLQGRADSAQYYSNGKIDEFGNYALTMERASVVMKFLLTDCAQCSPGFLAMRRKLTLAGVGDTLAPHGGHTRADDRTVDIVIDYSGDGS